TSRTRAIGNSREPDEALGLGSSESNAHWIAVSIIAVKTKSQVVHLAAGQRVGPSEGYLLRVNPIGRCKVAAAYDAIAGPRWILSASMAITVGPEQTIRLLQVVVHPAIK